VRSIAYEMFSYNNRAQLGFGQAKMTGKIKICVCLEIFHLEDIFQGSSHESCMCEENKSICKICEFSSERSKLFVRPLSNIYSLSFRLCHSVVMFAILIFSLSLSLLLDVILSLPSSIKMKGISIR
jgi:hypothetical protein